MVPEWRPQGGDPAEAFLSLAAIGCGTVSNNLCLFNSLSPGVPVHCGHCQHSPALSFRFKTVAG